MRLSRTRKVIELTASGFDENLQPFGGDPYGGMSNLGIRIPALPTPNQQSRYLVELASFSIPEGQHAKIVGYRQLVTIGYTQNQNVLGEQPYPLEFQVVTPFWHFADGGISWHLQSLGSVPSYGTASQIISKAVGPPLQSLAYRYSSGGSALLYEAYTTPSNLYVDMTAYTPPNQGRPWGRSLHAGHNATFYGLQTDYKTWGAWSALDIDVEGPDVIAYFASVYQTNPATRPVITLPSTPYPTGTLNASLPPEEQFIANFTGVASSGDKIRYYRVGGSLIVEMGGDPEAGP